MQVSVGCLLKHGEGSCRLQQLGLGLRATSLKCVHACCCQSSACGSVTDEVTDGPLAKSLVSDVTHRTLEGWCLELLLLT